MNCENSTRPVRGPTRPDRAAAGAPRGGAARAVRTRHGVAMPDATRPAGAPRSVLATARPNAQTKDTLGRTATQIATAIYIQIDRAVHVRSTRSQITPHAVRRVDCGWDGLTSSRRRD